MPPQAACWVCSMGCYRASFQKQRLEETQLSIRHQPEHGTPVNKQHIQEAGQMSSIKFKCNKLTWVYCRTLKTISCWMWVDSIQSKAFFCAFRSELLPIWACLKMERDFIFLVRNLLKWMQNPILWRCKPRLALIFKYNRSWPQTFISGLWCKIYSY